MNQNYQTFKIRPNKARYGEAWSIHFDIIPATIWIWYNFDTLMFNNQAKYFSEKTTFTAWYHRIYRFIVKNMHLKLQTELKKKKNWEKGCVGKMLTMVHWPKWNMWTMEKCEQLLKFHGKKCGSRKFGSPVIWIFHGSDFSIVHNFPMNQWTMKIENFIKNMKISGENKMAKLVLVFINAKIHRILDFHFPYIRFRF